MKKFEPNTCINISKLSFEKFIELHQALEDDGQKMYEPTSTRERSGTYYWQYIYLDGDNQWSGTDNQYSTPITYQDVMAMLKESITPKDITPTYEIY